MNKDRLSSLLAEPARVAREDLSGLKNITERYPWFSGAHLLLALGEHATGDVLFEETLRTTAAHLPSREVLFDQVHGQRSIADEEPKTVEAHRNVIHVPVEAPGARAEVAPELPAYTHDQLAERILQQQILEAAAASAYQLEADTEAAQAESGGPIAEVIPEVVPPVSTPLEVATPSVAATPPQPTIGPGTRLRFTEWLGTATGDSEPAVPFEREQAIEHARDWLRTGTGADAPAPAASTPELTRDLIDRFLKQSTPEPRPRTEFFSPQQAGRRSLEEQLDIVTETLARMHEKQGHWAKAAAAYHRLALKHPEKSGYFAALAKKAEQNLI